MGRLYVTTGRHILSERKFLRKLAQFNLNIELAKVRNLTLKRNSATSHTMRLPTQPFLSFMHKDGSAEAFISEAFHLCDENQREPVECTSLP